jgi:hypothetical protein
MIALAIMVVPSLAFGASLHQFTVAEATADAENQVVVPLNITNQDNLAAMDIPLQFSEGAVLKDVLFDKTRVAYFDLKVFNIDNEKHTVVIGLLPQMTQDFKPDLAAGTGPIANLVFEATDQPITVEALVTTTPAHSLTFVYHDENGAIRSENPDFESFTVQPPPQAKLIPEEFYMSQNYPNPFNPSTSFEFALPTPSHVNLTVFNVLGQQVTTVVDDNLGAGVYTYECNASNVSSGVYFYRLVTDENTETRKMMLLK